LGKRRKRGGGTPHDQKLEKSQKKGSFEVSNTWQNLVPKDMGNGLTQLALKKRQTGSTPLAKLKKPENN